MHVVWIMLWYHVYTRDVPSIFKTFFQPLMTRNQKVHYSDVIMNTMASQITSLTIVHSTVYSGADQRKYQSSALPAFVRGIHRWPVNSPHKRPVTRKCFHLITSSCYTHKMRPTVRYGVFCDVIDKWKPIAKFGEFIYACAWVPKLPNKIDNYNFDIYALLWIFIKWFQTEFRSRAL